MRKSGLVDYHQRRNILHRYRQQPEKKEQASESHDDQKALGPEHTSTLIMVQRSGYGPEDAKPDTEGPFPGMEWVPRTIFEIHPSESVGTRQIEVAV